MNILTFLSFLCFFTPQDSSRTSPAQTSILFVESYSKGLALLRQSLLESRTSLDSLKIHFKEAKTHLSILRNRNSEVIDSSLISILEDGADKILLITDADLLSFERRTIKYGETPYQISDKSAALLTYVEILSVKLDEFYFVISKFLPLSPTAKPRSFSSRKDISSASITFNLKEDSKWLSKYEKKRLTDNYTPLLLHVKNKSTTDRTLVADFDRITIYTDDGRKFSNVNTPENLYTFSINSAFRDSETPIWFRYMRIGENTKVVVSFSKSLPSIQHWKFVVVELSGSWSEFAGATVLLPSTN